MDEEVIRQFTEELFADPNYRNHITPEVVARNPEWLTNICLLYHSRLPQDFLNRLDEIASDHHSASDVARILRA